MAQCCYGQPGAAFENRVLTVMGKLGGSREIVVRTLEGARGMGEVAETVRGIGVPNAAGIGERIGYRGERGFGAFDVTGSEAGLAKPVAGLRDQVVPAVAERAGHRLRCLEHAPRGIVVAGGKVGLA